MTKAEQFVSLYEEAFGETLDDGDRQFLRLLVAHVDQEFTGDQCKALVLALARRDVGPEFELAVDRKYMAGIAQLCRDIEVILGILSKGDA